MRIVGPVFAARILLATALATASVPDFRDLRNAGTRLFWTAVLGAKIQPDAYELYLAEFPKSWEARLFNDPGGGLRMLVGNAIFGVIVVVLVVLWVAVMLFAELYV